MINFTSTKDFERNKWIILINKKTKLFILEKKKSFDFLLQIFDLNNLPFKAKYIIKI